MTEVQAGEAMQLAARLLRAAGVPGQNAGRTARVLVMSDAWGIGSHGLMRLPFYLRRLAAGGIDPAAELRTVSDTGSVVTLDGHRGLGHWQLWAAADLAARRCLEGGIAAVAVRDSNHCGALGVYTLPALDAGMIALVFSNGPAVMPAWGGQTALLSTSAMAAGVPTSPRWMIADFATSAVARGRIKAAARAGEPLQPGWATDADGQPTTDAEAALGGMLAPMGGVKGFALALVIELLTGGLTGPTPSADVPDMFAAADDAKPQHLGHLVLVLDPSRFGEDDGRAATERMNAIADSVVATGGRLPGGGRKRPGELAADDPITVDEATWAELTALDHPPTH